MDDAELQSKKYYGRQSRSHYLDRMGYWETWKFVGLLSRDINIQTLRKYSERHYEYACSVPLSS